MSGDDHAVLADDDPVGIGMDLDRAADGRRQDRVFVGVEANRAGLRHRPAEDYACIFGGNGGTGTTATRNCAVVACQSSGPRLLPVHRRDSGACQDIRRSNRPCATTPSSRSVSPVFMSLPKLNPAEPPWYVIRMRGVGGGAAPRGVPYPDQSRRPEIFPGYQPLALSFEAGAFGGG